MTPDGNYIFLNLLPWQPFSAHSAVPPRALTLPADLARHNDY